MASVSLEFNCSLNDLAEKSASAPSSPNERSSVLRDIAHIGDLAKCRRVTFPDDETIVTGYFEAPDPWSEEPPSTDNIVAAYRAACWKQGVKPLQKVLQQLQCVQFHSSIDFELNLIGENLEAHHCEALEEIFKRVQFRTVKLEDCNLDDEGAAAIFDMIEYYDSTSYLNISSNKNIGNNGWQACCKMLKKTPCLQYMDASGTAQNEQSLLILGRAFRTGAYLMSLRLENCGINGRSLVILVAALKLNGTLRELRLCDNRMCAADGLQLGNLLRSNSTLELLDLGNNSLQDLGICHLVDGLCQQSMHCGECLKTLHLPNSGLTKNGMAHINRALLVSESLHTLDVGRNAVCDEGVRRMKQGLLTNQSLRHLALAGASLTCEGAVAIAEFLADSQHAESVDLRDNELRLAGMLALALAMQHNRSVLALDVDDGRDPDEQRHVDEIRAHCERNRAHTESERSVDFVVQSSVPVICSDSELNSLIQGRSMPQNRFQVCRVFEKSKFSSQEDASNEDSFCQVDESVFLPSPLNETGYESGLSTKIESSEVKKSYIRHQDSLAIHKKLSRLPATEEPDSCGEKETPSQNGQSTKKKLTFYFPDDLEQNFREATTGGQKSNRRMSSPAVSSHKLLPKKNKLSLKLGRQLEGLDLKSSLPLSPTRIRECLVFPDPIELNKLPTVQES